MTPRQLKQIKNKYPEQDGNIILLGVLYLQRNLSDEEFNQAYNLYLDELFLAKPSTSEIVDELKAVINQFSSTTLPTIKHIKLEALTNSEAVTLSARLTAHSAFPLIMSDEEMTFADNPALQAASQLVVRTLDSTSNPDPQHIKQILNSLFEKYPETEKIHAFNDLMLQAELISDDDNTENDFVSYAKDKFSSRKKIGSSYLLDALAAFKVWKKNHKTHLGMLRKIIELADQLTAHYPTAKEEIIGFCFAMFEKSLVDKTLLPDYIHRFAELVNTLIALNDKQVVFSLCFHLANGNHAFPPWALIETLDHAVFHTLTHSQHRIIFNLITTSLNHHLPLHISDLRFILNRCRDLQARIILLQCLNGFYLKAPCPPLAAIVSWIKSVAENDISGLHAALSNGYLTFENARHLPKEASSILLERQLNKLKHDLDAYAHTSFLHTRKKRAAHLSQFSANQLNSIDAKTSEEQQAMKQQTIAELYFHYATIENASGILSRTLEKRLIKLLEIPNDDSLKAAKEKRDSFSYKLQTFFCAGRSFFKRYRDKDKDPVHDIIMSHLSPEMKSQLNHLQSEMGQLDELDRTETTLFSAAS